MEYLLSATDVYRVETVEDVERLHDKLKADNNFELIAFSYKTKYIKAQGEIIGEYQVVSAKKVFNDEKEPNTTINIKVYNNLFLTSGVLILVLFPKKNSEPKQNLSSTYGKI